MKIGFSFSFFVSFFPSLSQARAKYWNSEIWTRPTVVVWLYLTLIPWGTSPLLSCPVFLLLLHKWLKCVLPAEAGNQVINFHCSYWKTLIFFLTSVTEFAEDREDPCNYEFSSCSPESTLLGFGAKQ